MQALPNDNSEAEYFKLIFQKHYGEVRYWGGHGYWEELPRDFLLQIGNVRSWSYRFAKTPRLAAGFTTDTSNTGTRPP